MVDILIRNGKIVEIGRRLGACDETEVDGTGLVAIPGVVETHAHMLLPFGGTCTRNDFFDVRALARMGA